MSGIFCRLLSLQMPFFQHKTKAFFDQTLKDLTHQYVALGKHRYLPYINSSEGFTTRISQYSCYVYLCLLTRFINIAKDLSEQDLKVYLVRSEYRYFRFMSFADNGGPPPLGMCFFLLV